MRGPKKTQTKIDGDELPGSRILILKNYLSNYILSSLSLLTLITQLALDTASSSTCNEAALATSHKLFSVTTG